MGLLRPLSAWTCVWPPELPASLAGWDYAQVDSSEPISNISDLDYDCSVTNRDVSFSYYPYLRTPNLQRLQPADRSFLKTQKSFHVPSEPILDAVMSRYFLYVHPCLPVINEAEFWRMLNQEASGKVSFSLLVFQAMMFAACSVRPHTPVFEMAS